MDTVSETIEAARQALEAGRDKRAADLLPSPRQNVTTPTTRRLFGASRCAVGSRLAGLAATAGTSRSVFRSCGSRISINSCLCFD